MNAHLFEEKPMKNILIICDKFKDYNNGHFGHAVRISSIYNHLVEHGYNVYTILVSNFKEGSYKYDKCILNFMGDFPAKPDQRNIFHYCIDFLLKKEIDTVISTSPSLYSHTLANELKEHASENLRWIMDIRDLASRHPVIAKTEKEIEYFEKKEIEFIQSSDICTVVTKGMRDEIIEISKRISPEIDMGKLHVIENGFLKHNKKRPNQSLVKFINKNNKKKIFIYSGSGSLGKDRKNKDITILTDIIIKENDIKEKAALVLQGPIAIDEEYLKKLKAHINVLVLPPADYHEAISNMKICDIGINLNADKSHCSQIIGGKTYDYIGSGLALFLIFPEGSTSIENLTAELDQKPALANTFSPDMISRRLNYLCNHPNIEEIKISSLQASQYSREEQVRKFITLISSTNPLKSPAQEDFYNESYRTGGYKKEYFRRYWETSYFFPWSVVLDILIKGSLDKKILDIGCGPGQFASMLQDNGFENYTGIDLSSQAIEIAKRNNPELSDRFKIVDIRENGVDADNFDFLVSLEVIEHIFNDIELISALPKSKKFIFSVPNYDSKTHVRLFNNPKEIINRYSGLIDIKNIYICRIGNSSKKIFIIESITK